MKIYNNFYHVKALNLSPRGSIGSAHVPPAKGNMGLNTEAIII